MGDFNINLLGVGKCNKYAHNFLLSLQSFSLFRQLIKPTRFHNNSATLIIYIEIILLNRFDYNITSGNIVSAVSDHYSPFCCILHSVEAQMYNRKQKNVISLQGRIQEFLNFFFFWGGGPNFGLKRTVELICLSICERRSPLAREPALRAEANRS